MDLIKEALSMGFANAAIMDTKDLVFVPEYRQFCEDNLCGNYNLDAGKWKRRCPDHERRTV